MGAQCCTPTGDYMYNADEFGPDEWFPGDAVVVIEPFMTNDQLMSPVRIPKGLNLIITKISQDRLAVRAYGVGNSEIWENRKTYIVAEKHFDKLELPQHEFGSLERKESIDERPNQRRRAPPELRKKRTLSPTEIAERVKRRDVRWQTMVESYEKIKKPTKDVWVDPATVGDASRPEKSPKKIKHKKKQRRSLEEVDFGDDNEGAAHEQPQVLSERERIIVKKFNGDRQKWGVKVNLGDDLNEWRVLDLQPSGQFANKGVKVGWRFLKINTFQFKENNRSMVEIILEQHQKCRITFLDDSSVVDIHEEPAPPAPVGEVLHTHVEEDYDDNGFVPEDDFENIPEVDSDVAEEVAAGASISAEEAPHNILSSPSAPMEPTGSLDDPHLPDPHEVNKESPWKPATSPLPDRPETPAVVDPVEVMHSSSEDIQRDDHEHQRNVTDSMEVLYSIQENLRYEYSETEADDSFMEREDDMAKLKDFRSMNWTPSQSVTVDSRAPSRYRDRTRTASRDGSLDTMEGLHDVRRVLSEEFSDTERDRIPSVTPTADSMQRLRIFRFGSWGTESSSHSTGDSMGLVTPILGTPIPFPDLTEKILKDDYELGDELDIRFKNKPFGFSIIEDEYGENAYIDGIQKDWLEEKGLRMNAQVIEIDGHDTIGVEYGDIIDIMRNVELPAMIRFRYSLGPDLPPEDDEQWDDDEYVDRSAQSDSYHKYEDEGEDEIPNSPHTSDRLPDELAEFEEIVPESPKEHYREPSSSPRYGSSASPKYREPSTSPLPATRSESPPKEKRESAFKQSISLFEAGSDPKEQKDGYIVPKHKRNAFKKGLSLFEVNGDESPKQKKKKRKSTKKRAAFADALALFQQNESESEKPPTKKKSGRRRKGKQKEQTEDSGDETPSWARKEGESKRKMKKGFQKNESAI